MKLALRVEVGTLRGARVAAPRLARLLEESHTRATFLFNLGPDRSGRALKSLPRASRMACFGAATLFSGTLLPAPDVGRQCAAEMRAIAEAGFEAGILAWDRSDWVRHVAGAGDVWTRCAMERACERFGDIFGAPALTHGAPGWQMNRHAYRHTQRLGFRQASDSRGTAPFIPIVEAEIATCPQIPTTLPALDELLAGGLDTDAAVRRLLELSADPPPTGHVYTMHAELEGGPYARCLAALIAGWHAAGYEMVSLADYAAGFDAANLPRRIIVSGEAPGSRFPRMSTEGGEFLA